MLKPPSLIPLATCMGMVDRVNMRLKILAPIITNRIDAEMWPVSRMMDLSVFRSSLRRPMAINKAPAAPTAPDSVGVKKPA